MHNVVRIGIGAAAALVHLPLATARGGGARPITTHAHPLGIHMPLPHRVRPTAHAHRLGIQMPLPPRTRAAAPLLII